METRLEDEEAQLGLMRNKCARQNGNNNNNDDQFAPEQHQKRRSSGTSSGDECSGSGSPSNESAFSSASSDEDESSSEARNCSSPSSSSARNSLTPSSGRSSATNENQGSDSSSELGASPTQMDLTNQLNTVVNVAPSTSEVHELVDKVRLRFLANLPQDEQERLELYEELDLSEIQRQLPENYKEHDQALAFRLISRFINFHNMAKYTESEQAIDDLAGKLSEFLKFRKHNRLTNVLVDQFCKEIYLLYGIFPFGCDKNGLPIMYLRARVHRKWSHELDEVFRRYVAWQVDLMTKSYAGAQVSRTIGRNGIEKDGSFGICFDCLHVSYSCVDMDFLSYLVKVLVHYYPTYCRYALCVDLPWLFRSVWKLVRSWLPEDARNTVHLITSKQLTEFIDEDQIPNSMRSSDTPADKRPASGKHQVPENFDSVRSIEQLADDLNLNSSEVKQFKSHVDKVLKEYKQLGAI